MSLNHLRARLGLNTFDFVPNCGEVRVACRSALVFAKCPITFLTNIHPVFPLTNAMWNTPFAIPADSLFFSEVSPYIPFLFIGSFPTVPKITAVFALKSLFHWIEI